MTAHKIIKRRAALAAMALFAFVSCNIESVETVRIEAPARVFQASIEAPESQDTKVYADENLKVLWTEDDRVSIFDKNTYNRQYKFNGQTGDNSGSFSVVPSGDYVTGNELDAAYAVYPYSESTAISNSGELSLTLPAVQNYAADSFGLGANTMVAATAGDMLVFKNVCGYLMFKLYGEGISVTSLKLEGKGGEVLAGAASVTMAPGGVPAVSMAPEGAASVTVKCESPVVLGPDAEHYTAFWFVLPPVTFTNGFKLTVSLSDGGLFKKETDAQVTITRNTRSRLSPVEVVPIGPEAVDLGLSVKWASFNVGATTPSEYGFFFQWGDTEEHGEYAWASYLWCGGSAKKLTKYNTSSEYGTVDDLITLEPQDDAAHVYYGGKWRMPTREECEELWTSGKCSWAKTTLDGVAGYLITSNVEGHTDQSVFFPFTGYKVGQVFSTHYNLGTLGYFWSSSLDTDCPNQAYHINLSPEYLGIKAYVKGFSRASAIPVRAVQE